MRSSSEQEFYLRTPGIFADAIEDDFGMDGELMVDCVSANVKKRRFGKNVLGRPRYLRAG